MPDQSIPLLCPGLRSSKMDHENYSEHNVSKVRGRSRARKFRIKKQNVEKKVVFSL